MRKLDSTRGDGRGGVVCVGFERVTVRSEVHNKKTRLRSMRRGPSWLGIIGLSQADDALVSRSTTPIIPALIRGVELVEARDNEFLHPCSRAAGGEPLGRAIGVS